MSKNEFIVISILVVGAVSIFIINMNLSTYKSSKSYEADKEELSRAMAQTTFQSIYETRSRVREEIQDYLSFIHKNESQLIPELGGVPVRCMLSTTWNSGSSYIGEALAKHPGAFYFYEPLWRQMIFRRIRDVRKAYEIIQYLKEQLFCAFTDIEKTTEHLNMVGQNEIRWFGKHKNPNNHSVEEISSYCRLYPVQIIKILRLGSSLLETLLQDSSLNVRVILMVRDPRAQLMSHQRHRWCRKNEECIDPAIVCSDQYDDYKALQKLKHMFPARIMGIRLEDITSNPLKTISELYDFCGLQRTESLLEHVMAHSRPPSANISNDRKRTYRNASEVSIEWKKKLPWSDIDRVQSACGPAMEVWGYKKVEENNRMDKETFVELNI